MILKSIKVKNFRSIRDETLDCEDLTVLVGANGSGKSSFLHAIDLFQSRTPGVTEEDYHNRQTENNIEITSTFRNLSSQARETYSDYVLDGKLTVVRIFKWDDGRCGTTYHGIRLQNPDFARIYGQKAGVAKQNYEEMQKRNAYREFPKWSNLEKMTEFLREWERANPDRCEEAWDDGKFFKNGPGGQGVLDRFVRFLYVKPVRDAAEDAQEEKNSALAALMDLAVKNTLSEKNELKEFVDDVRKKYRNLMCSAEQEELKELGERISGTISHFVPDAQVNLSWHSTDLSIGHPKAEIKLVEDGYRSTVTRTGHGLQRIFIMSILQHLAEAQTGRAEGSSDESPTMVLVIDEPELYQHPNRQRHMSQVFRSLATGSILGVLRGTQIVCSTHSPHFVGMDKLNQIRLLRKTADGHGRPRETRISSTSLGKVAAALPAMSGQRTTTARALEQKLRTIMTPMMNEGFFADVVVLVEGEGDRAALTAAAKSMGIPLESHGISVIQCGGKPNLGRPAAIFRQLRIPLYVVWDNDRRNVRGPELNRELLSIMGQHAEDWPSGVRDTCACFEGKIEDVMMAEIGPIFAKYRRKCRKELGITEQKITKKPYVISWIIENAKRDGIPCMTLEEIVQKIRRLCPEGAVKL